MSAPPRVSVVMPVHDAEQHLATAMASMLGQTFGDFELIVVDDASTDGSAEIVRRFAAEDDRVRTIALDEQLGVAGALNAGIACATAPLLARMDADDIARPERLERQVAEMEQDANLGVLGAQIEIIDDDGAPGESFGWELPLTHDETAWRLIFGSPICHPTVLMRTDIVREVGGYDPTFPNEDMELWTRMAFVARMRTLDAVLLDYRMPATTHAAKLAAWQPHITKVSARYLERILGTPVAHDAVRALRGQPAEGTGDLVFAALTQFTAASLLAEAFVRMRTVKVLCGDGLEIVRELMESQVHELATSAHLEVARRN